MANCFDRNDSPYITSLVSLVDQWRQCNTQCPSSGTGTPNPQEGLLKFDTDLNILWFQKRSYFEQTFSKQLHSLGEMTLPLNKKATGEIKKSQKQDGRDLSRKDKGIPIPHDHYCWHDKGFFLTGCFVNRSFKF